MPAERSRLFTALIMEEEKKVIVRLKKEPLESERREIRSRRRRRFLIFLLCALLFIGGFVLGTGASYFRSGSDYLPHSSDKFDTIKEYLTRVWLYNNDYENLEEVIEDKAYYGMTYFEEDPYTTYMSKEELDSFASGINMDYVGIGVQYYLLNNTATITRVFKESPAENAGIKAGDILKEVDGISLDGADTETIRRLVLGEKGTTVDIAVDRNGEEMIFTVVRGEVYSTVYAGLQDGYLILSIMSFGDNTANEIIRYLDDYRDYDRLIIDLRDNSGGYQTAVQEVAGLFLGKGKVVMNQTYNNGSSEAAVTISNDYFGNFRKVVILVNNGTASAAEVLAICLSELHENCILVGETTYGKGVVQSSYRLSDGSALKVTTSAWSSPNGRSINGEGITPDYEVKLDEIFYTLAVDMDEDDEYTLDSVSEYNRLTQLALKYLGYGPKRTDGYFDENFRDTLNVFKKDNGLKTDGILDHETYKTVFDRVSYVYAMDYHKDPQLNKAKELIDQN